MKRFQYSLLINNEPGGKPYFFSYGQTREISLWVSSAGARISRSFPKDYRHTGTDSFLMNLLREGIKKASLVYLLKYRRPLKIRTLLLETVTPDGSTETAELTGSLVLFSMIESPVTFSDPAVWKRHEVIQAVLNCRKNDPADSRKLAALYAWLYSKTKYYRTERFLNLWIAFNGMYGCLSPETNNDRLQINRLVEKYSLGDEILTKDYHNPFGKSTMILLKGMNEPISCDSLKNGIHRDLAKQIEGRLKHVKNGSKNLSAYGYLLTDFPYFLRCSLFHANRPLDLFSFADDMELNALRIANGLLEEFLDRHLVDIFSNSTF